MFWKLKESNLFELYKLVLCYCIFIIGFCDVERLFFVYSEILDEKYRFFDESIIKVFYFLNWNFWMRYLNEQEREQQSKRKIVFLCSVILNEFVKVISVLKRSLCKVREMSFLGCLFFRKKEFNIFRQFYKLKILVFVQGKF